MLVLARLALLIERRREGWFGRRHAAPRRRGRGGAPPCPSPVAGRRGAGVAWAAAGASERRDYGWARGGGTTLLEAAPQRQGRGLALADDGAPPASPPSSPAVPRGSRAAAHPEAPRQPAAQDPPRARPPARPPTLQPAPPPQVSVELSGTSRPAPPDFDPYQHAISVASSSGEPAR